MVSPTQITCTFTLPAGTTLGSWNLYVQNPDHQSATKSGAFTVKSPQYTWYLAEGDTSGIFSTYISIANPNTSAVHATLTYMTTTGTVSGGTLTLPAKSQTTVNPASKVGAKQFATKVVCTEGKPICADRTVTWTGPGATGPEGHSSVGVTTPAKTWYLPEGSSAWGFDCKLALMNPNSSTATVTLTYMIEGSGPVTKTKTVAGNRRATFNMASDIGSKDASIKVTSNIPVVPERSMYRNNYREGHCSIGTTAPAADFYLAEGTSAWGFTTYVLVQNPSSSAATVNITFMTGTGPVAYPAFSMPANSRKTIRVNDFLPNKDFSTRVHGSKADNRREEHVLGLTRRRGLPRLGGAFLSPYYLLPSRRAVLTGEGDLDTGTEPEYERRNSRDHLHDTHREREQGVHGYHPRQLAQDLQPGRQDTLRQGCHHGEEQDLGQEDYGRARHVLVEQVRGDGYHRGVRGLTPMCTK